MTTGAEGGVRGGPGEREDGSGNRDGLTRPSSAGLESSDGEVTDGAEDGLGRPGDVGDGSAQELEFHDGDEYRVRPWWARTSTLVAVVVVLFVLSGGVTAWLRISDLEQQVSELEAHTLAAESARQAAILLAQDLATYDYRDLGGNFRHVAAAATPRFAEQLSRLSAELGPELQQTRAVATATTRSAGVVRADQDEAVIVVLIDQSVTNTKTPEPRVERSRMELTLLRQAGVWRLDQAGEL